MLEGPVVSFPSKEKRALPKPNPREKWKHRPLGDKIFPCPGCARSCSIVPRLFHSSYDCACRSRHRGNIDREATLGERREGTITGPA